jgi:hypothetical protein
MSLVPQAIEMLDNWYNSLKRFQDKLPARGTVTAALHVLHRLQANYDLRSASHVAVGGESQIAGISPSSVRKLLIKFGETRTLSSVAGRSNRGSRGAIANLLSALRPLRLESLREEERNEALIAMQRHIVESYVPRYFAVKRVKATFDVGLATCRFVKTILENAAKSGKAGAVAEYLVGAKLAVLFPKKSIRNKSYSTADAQAGFAGDFEVGKTAFHVTIAPMPELFAKCQQNLERGMRVYLLVPDARVVGTKQNAEMSGAGRIAVESIEGFVATNIDERCEFESDERLRSGLRHLLEVYNTRVEQVELDKSLLIEIPPNLA